MNNQVLRGIKYTMLYKDSGFKYPNFWDRINDIRKLERVNMIVIDGKAQTGKSTLAQYIAEHYDKDFKTVFTVKEILDYVKDIGDIYYSDYDRWLNMRYKWLFWDEPNLEAVRNEWWSQRNTIIQLITSSYGFLKLNMILALPNVKGLSDIILTNISMRISVRSLLDKDRKIKRIATIRKPFWLEGRNKFVWIAVETFTIPELSMNKEYESAKADNFFKNQLVSWYQRLNKEDKSVGYIPSDNDKNKPQNWI
jgi:hypothetical protein